MIFSHLQFLKFVISCIALYYPFNSSTNPVQ